MSGYEITQRDIDAMLNYLKIFDPKNANREYAEEFLRYLKAASRRLVLTDPDAIDELYKAFVDSKKK